MTSVNEICRWGKRTDKVGTPEEIAKAVHYYLDWVRACKARQNDRRDFDTEQLLEVIQKGYELTKYFDIHYLGD